MGSYQLGLDIQARLPGALWQQARGRQDWGGQGQAVCRTEQRPAGPGKIQTSSQSSHFSLLSSHVFCQRMEKNWDDILCSSRSLAIFVKYKSLNFIKSLTAKTEHL